MICTVCREAHTTHSLTSLQFERDEFRATVHHIPAQICPACGESYLEEEVTAKLLDRVQQSMAEGELDIVLDYL